MKLSTLRMLLAARYERLFARRFSVENECDNEVEKGKDSKRQRRLSAARDIFPTESKFPRYQY